jgi:hypothetical protein
MNGSSPPSLKLQRATFAIIVGLPTEAPKAAKFGAGEEVFGAGDERSSKTLRFINQSVSAGKDILETLCWTQRWTFIHNFLESWSADFLKNPKNPRARFLLRREFSQPFFHRAVDDPANVSEQRFQIGGCWFTRLMHAPRHLVQVASDPAQHVISEPLRVAR